MLQGAGASPHRGERRIQEKATRPKGMARLSAEEEVLSRKNAKKSPGRPAAGDSFSRRELEEMTLRGLPVLFIFMDTHFRLIYPGWMMGGRSQVSPEKPLAGRIEW